MCLQALTSLSSSLSSSRSPCSLSLRFSSSRDRAKCISRDFQTRVLGVLISSRGRYSSWISIGDIASTWFYDAIRVLRSYDDGISIRRELARRLRISRAKGANRYSIGTSSTMNSRYAIDSLQEVPFGEFSRINFINSRIMILWNERRARDFFPRDSSLWNVKSSTSLSQAVTYFHKEISALKTWSSRILSFLFWK